MTRTMHFSGVVSVFTSLVIYFQKVQYLLFFNYLQYFYYKYIIQPVTDMTCDIADVLSCRCRWYNRASCILNLLLNGMDYSQLLQLSVSAVLHFFLHFLLSEMYKNGHYKRKEFLLHFLHISVICQFQQYVRQAAVLQVCSSASVFTQRFWCKGQCSVHIWLIA